MDIRKMLSNLLESDKQIGGQLFKDLVRTPISDAYWSLTHPIDRLTGQGRASEQTMAIPVGPIRGMPGYQVVRASPGEMYRTWNGGNAFVPERTFGGYNPTSYDFPRTISRRRAARDREELGHPPRDPLPVDVYYNALDPEGEIVGSMTAQMGKRRLAVPEAFVEESYRKTPIFQALGEQVIKLQPHLPVSADFANAELALVASRYLRSHGRELEGVRQSDIIHGQEKRRMKLARKKIDREAKRQQAKEQRMSDLYDIRTEAPPPPTPLSNVRPRRGVVGDPSSLAERLARVEQSAIMEARRRMIPQMIAGQPGSFQRSIRRQHAAQDASIAEQERAIQLANEIFRNTRNKQTMRHMGDVYHAHGRERRSGR